MGARVSGRGHYSSTTKRIFGRTDCRPHMPMEVGRQVGAGVRGRGRLCVLDLWYGVGAVRVLTYSMLLVRRERLGYARTPSCTCRAWRLGGWGAHGKLFFRSDRGRIESGTHKITALTSRLRDM